MNLLSNRYLLLIVAGVLTTGVVGCGDNATNRQNEPAGISPQAMADALHAVMESDRTVYARQVVHRLQDKEEVILASEHWQDDKALPLPAQMFRMGAEMVAEKTDAFSYALLSKWPVNKKNAPKTEVEISGLDRGCQRSVEAFLWHGVARRHGVLHGCVCRCGRLVRLRDMPQRSQRQPP